MEQFQFDGRVVVVTGAGNGLGRAYAHELGRRGARVVVNDLGTSAQGSGESRRAAEQVVEEIEKLGGKAIPNFDSVSTEAGGRAIIETAIKAWGRVDAVVANAGILRDKSFHKLEAPDFDAVLDVHLRGTFFTVQPAFKAMKDSGSGGHIVLTSSAVALFGNFGQANYVAAKLGIVGLTTSLAIEGERSNIRTNCIAPMASTRLTRKEAVDDPDDPRAPHRVAPLAAYLCHPACTSSGQVFVAGNNYFSRAALMLSEGWAAQPEELSMEGIAAHWDQIGDLNELHLLKSGYDIVDILKRKVPFLQYENEAR